MIRLQRVTLILHSKSPFIGGPDAALLRPSIDAPEELEFPHDSWSKVDLSQSHPLVPT